MANNYNTKHCQKLSSVNTM